MGDLLEMFDLAWMTLGVYRTFDLDDVTISGVMFPGKARERQ